jgi:hypothetical protein
MGVAVPEGRVAYTAEEAVEKAKELDSKVYVLDTRGYSFSILLFLRLSSYSIIRNESAIVNSFILKKQ